MSTKLNKDIVEVLEEICNRCKVSKHYAIDTILRHALIDDERFTTDLIQHYKSQVVTDFDYASLKISYVDAYCLRDLSVELMEGREVHAFRELYEDIRDRGYPFKSSQFYESFQFLTEKGIISIDHSPAIKRKRRSSYYIKLTDIGCDVLAQMNAQDYLSKHVKIARKKHENRNEVSL